MAEFIARIFGGGKKKESSAPAKPAPVVEKREVVADPKSQTRFAGAAGRKRELEEQAKTAKKMLLGE